MDPFNSSPPASTTPESGPPCPSCQRPMDPSRGSYDANGQLICQTCSAISSSSAASATMEAGDPTSVRNIYGAAAASSLIGVLTCCLSGMGAFFFMASPLAILTGGGTLLNLFRNPRLRTELGAGYWLVIAGAVAGILFGALGILIGVASLIGFANG